MRVRIILAAAICLLFSSVMFAGDTTSTQSMLRLVPGTPSGGDGPVVNGNDPTIKPNEGSYGVANWQVLNVGGFNLGPYSGTVINSSFSGYVYSTGASGAFGTNLDLPNGAAVWGVTVWGHDSNATAGANFTAEFDQLNEDNTWTTLWTLAPASTYAPGDFKYFQYFSGGPVTVDNWHKQYRLLAWSVGANDPSMKAFVFWYKRQISPAPVTPTFVDVPNDGSIFYQSVQAMAASGITLGCDATHYCPNNAVSRLQMAVFFARALGLNWDAYYNGL